MQSYITGIGVYRPSKIMSNDIAKETNFIKEGNIQYSRNNSDIISKFEEITDITHRTIAAADILPSDMGYFAASDAIESSNIDKENIDYLIAAHNWGDTSYYHRYFDLLPNIAARIKNKLKIENPNCVAYDILFGCPGWIEGLKQADILIKSGEAQKVLVIGTDAVSRVVEKCDIDSLLFSDGSGAVILEKANGEEGILGHKTLSHCGKEIEFLKMGKSYDSKNNGNELFLKMKGKRVFKYAMENVPKIIKECLTKANLSIDDIQYFLIHQANGKMIKMIGKKLFEEFGQKFNEAKVPIIVGKMGNNSVATIPTLLYDLKQKKVNNRGIRKGDNVIFASVGAGMHTNCLIHKF